MATSKKLSDLMGGSEPSAPESAAPRLITVKTDRLLPNPHNPRDEIGDVSDLASIAEKQLQSLLVVSKGAYLGLYPDEVESLRGIDYIVANGNRRHAAAVQYGREELLCIFDDSVAVSRAALLRAAYDENVARKDFDPIEEARAMVSIIVEYDTAKEAAAAQGWSQSTISLRKNLLKLHPDVQNLVRLHARTNGAEGVAVRNARDLGSVDGIETMTFAEQMAELDNLTSRKKAKVEAERAAKRQLKEAARSQPSPDTPQETSGQGASVAANPDQFSAENRPAAVDQVTSVGDHAPTSRRPKKPASAPRDDQAAPTDEFSAENSPHPAEGVPDPRRETVPRSGAAEPDFSLSGVDWHDVDALANAICRILTKDEAYKLADALANRILQA